MPGLRSRRKKVTIVHEPKEAAVHGGTDEKLFGLLLGKEYWQSRFETLTLKPAGLGHAEWARLT